MRRIALFTTLAILAAGLAIGLWQLRATGTIQRESPLVVETATALVGGERAIPNQGESAPADNAIGKAEARISPSGESASGEGDRPEAKATDAQGGSGQPDDHEQSVTLNTDQMQASGVRVAVAGPGPIAVRIERPAEIKFDNNRVIHVVPRVAGIVSQVEVSQGQNVSKDALLAVLRSRELAELKAAYLADFERRGLAFQTFERERSLWEKKISSEKDYLVAKTALAEADIALRTSGQKLRALGFSQQYVDSLATSKDADLTEYEIRAPMGGAVIERHVSLGEAVSTEKEVFIIADVSLVWVDVTLYANDLSLVRAGQKVNIDLGDGNPIEGKIEFVTPNVSEATRTGVARVVLDNPDGFLKPGMFIKASIDVGEEQASIRLPRSAVQNYKNGSVVFVKEGEKFEPRPVQLGRDNPQFVEVVSGVSAGETYVTEGAFTLKSLIQKSQMGEGHGH